MLNYHPLVIYRFQVLKQADVVLALFLQGEHFSLEQKRVDFECYDPITTGDSTLSGVVQSIMAAEVGYRELALHYFKTSLFVDLANLHGNTTDGVHVASTGGVWNMLVFGFGGMRDHDGVITFDPRLPDPWERLSFQVTLKNTRVQVDLTRGQIAFSVVHGDRAELAVRGHRFTVSAAARSGFRWPTGPHPQWTTVVPDRRPAARRHLDHRLGPALDRRSSARLTPKGVR